MLTWILQNIQIFSIIIFRPDEKHLSEEEKPGFVTSAIRKKKEGVFWWSFKPRTI